MIPTRNFHGLARPGQEYSDAPLRERWAYVGILPNTGFDEVGYELPAKTSIQDVINMMYNYRLERTGTYHLLKSYFPDYIFEDRISLTVPFSVTEIMINQQPAVSDRSGNEGQEKPDETIELSVETTG